MSISVEDFFKNAPPDATHYADCCHYKIVGDTWMVHMSGDEWEKSESMYNGQIKQSDIVARPQPKPWSGPEDGLPPVGSVCEQQTWVNRLWRKVEVVAHFNKFAVCAWEESPGDSQVELAPPYDLRLPTDEIDQRETAIRELMDIAQVDCRVTAARLVDAGFKR